MTKESFLILIICLTVPIYMIQIVCISLRNAIFVVYCNLVLLIGLILLMMYNIYCGYHIHMYLVNIIIWTLVGKSMMKSINVKRLERLINKKT